MISCFTFPREGSKVEMEVTIVDSTGKSFPESTVTRDDKGALHYWIPAVEGQAFEIRWTVSGPKPYSGLDVQATPYLDGVEMDCGILFADQWAKGMEGWLDGHQVGADKSCPFQFGRLELTDDKSKADYVCAEDLHTIRVELEWGRSRPQNTRRKTRPRFSRPKTKRLIHEKAVKTGNYSSARLGSPVPSDDLSYTIQPFNPVKTSVSPAVFIFHYASTDWLQANATNISWDSDLSSDKEVIDVDEIESEPEQEQEQEQEIDDNSADESQVEVMIITDPDPSECDEIKVEPGYSDGAIRRDRVVTYSNNNDVLGRQKIMESDKIKPEPRDEVTPNQLRDEDEDVLIYKIMVPVSNLRLPTEDVKVKLEPSS